MHQAVVDRLVERIRTYEDLLGLLPEGALSESLPVPSNSIGAQLWCVVGARESYATALVDGEWAGFTCSMAAEGTRRSDAVLASLRSSAGALRDALDGVEWTARREALALDLLEHEAQHQGQLIRYVYGLGYSFPESWKSRWALD